LGSTAATDSSGNIYAIGGYSGGVGINTVEKYNPATNTWTTVAPMPTARAGLAAAVDSSGNIYAIGGTNGGSPQNTVEKYNPSTNTWSSAAPMSTARMYLAAGSTSTIPSVPPTAPQPPTGLKATTTSSSQINLSWSAPSSNGGSAITGYEIERSVNSGTTWSTVQSNTANTSTTYSNTGLAASTTYTYRVSAINNIGTSSPSNTSSATTSSTPPPPTTTQVTISVKSVNLSGNPITGMSTVIRYANGTTISEGFTPVSFTVTSGTTYVVHVRDYMTTVFNHWNDGSTNSYYTITPTQNVVLTAYYAG
jgi:hypothetical protein